MKSDDRKTAYKEINEATNSITIATYGVAAVGINIASHIQHGSFGAWQVFCAGYSVYRSGVSVWQKIKTLYKSGISQADVSSQNDI